MFCYLIGFARYKRFIYSNFAVGNNSVGSNLVSCVQDYNIVKHKLFRRNIADFSVTDYRRTGGAQESKIIKYLLASQLLYDSDYGVSAIIGRNIR